MCVVALASLFAASSAFASGYRIPEQSVDSTAKSGANIASATGADAAYFNPANMSWMENGWQAEVGASLVHLSSISYDDARTSAFDGSSEEENIAIPSAFLVSPDYDNFRFGLSLTAPYGLAKRWQADPFPKTFADKFSLKVIELNPTVAYKINDIVSVAAGVRLLYNQATVMSSGGIAPGVMASRIMDGDSVEWGYNLAVAVKPCDNVDMAVTYRSNVDLDFEGDVTLATNVGPSPWVGDGAVTVTAPAVLALSAAYTMDDWTFELTIDRTFWSEYESLDFTYTPALINPVLAATFTRSVRNYEDTTAIRLGVTYDYSEEITLMAGFAYDENPVPEANLGFELPDSDAYLFSAGARFKIDENMEFGIACLYDLKEERTVNNGTINGEFTDASAFLVTAGLSYKF